MRIVRTGPPGPSRVEFSSDLRQWSVVAAKSDESDWTYKVPVASAGYYRAIATEPVVVEENPGWSATFDSGTSATGKFTILLDDPSKVYFQDLEAYPFHFQFGTEWLPPFQGLTALEYNQQTLLPGTGQRAIVGNILRADEFLTGSGSVNGRAIRFIGGDGYPPELIRYLFELVASKVVYQHEWQHPEFYYLPTERQFPHALENRLLLRSHGIEIIDPTERSSKVAYSSGWAMGRLVYEPGDEVNQAFREGRLKSEDVLVTDVLPPELPSVHAILTLTPVTPHSHVVILAESLRVPVGLLHSEADHQRALALDSQKVVVKVDEATSSVQVHLYDEVSQEARTYLESTKEFEKPGIQAMTPTALPYAVPIQSEIASEISHVGGKAANFQQLERLLENAPDWLTIETPSPAIALTFSLWREFLQQRQTEGETLKDRIEDRLAPFENSLEIAALDDALAEVRSWIREGTFPAAAQSDLITAMQIFPPEERIRFRSSTNVEDTEGFVGAGLYDSFSGCLLDDTDSDVEGPSQCDPERAKERGTFRAIKKVYASFYNLNAYLLRRQFHLSEEEVGMGVLVHPSFPDEVEAANGVAVTKDALVFESFRPNEPDYYEVESQFVSQVGAVSIANPSSGERPEIVFSEFTGIHIDQQSSLLPSGQSSVIPIGEYGFLAGVLGGVHREVLGEGSSKRLEFEYKKLVDERFVVKQMRTLPPSGGGRVFEKAAVVGKSSFILLQNQHSFILSNHRLKMHLQAEPDGTTFYEPGQPISYRGRLTTPHPSGELEMSTLDLRSGDQIFGIQWHHRGQTYDSQWAVIDSLRSPLVNLGDFMPGGALGVTVNVPRETPLVIPQGFPHLYGEPPGPEGLSTETVFLRPGTPDDPPSSGSKLISRSVSLPGGRQLDTEFYWFDSSSRYTEQTVGPTYALDRFKTSRLSGFTSEPIVLTDYWSQTYQPTHHNGLDAFVFEPRLSGNVTEAQLEELGAQDIRALYVLSGTADTDLEHDRRLWLQGFSGKWRLVLPPE